MSDEFNPKYKVDALIENLKILRDRGMETITRNQILSMLIYKPLIADESAQQSVQRTDGHVCEKCGGVGDSHDAEKHGFVRTISH